jgi:putative oxidoreductase
MTITERWKSYAPHLRSLLRIFAAFMLMQNGTMKVLGWPMGMPPDGHTANLLTQIGFGGLLEAVGGLFLVFGLCTRPIAFVLAGEMAVAYWQFHFKVAQPWPIENGGAAAILYCFIWFYFSAAGAGEWSVDSWLENRKKA